MNIAGAYKSCGFDIYKLEQSANLQEAVAVLSNLAQVKNKETPA